MPPHHSALTAPHLSPPPASRSAALTALCSLRRILSSSCIALPLHASPPSPPLPRPIPLPPQRFLARPICSLFVTLAFVRAKSGKRHRCLNCSLMATVMTPSNLSAMPISGIMSLYNWYPLCWVIIRSGGFHM
ncbi:hypothetical protein DAI22_03g235800 [Oryza sativa Japonica Group]|nr:hypothetical protein DAI22_03g235800 [Oryza sativa Japonica Group]